jgi:hypothetical protein
LRKYKKKFDKFLKDSIFLITYKRLTNIHQSNLNNVYHCCTQRTASQWFANLFSDIRVFRYCALDRFSTKKFFNLINHPKNIEINASPGYRSKLFYFGDSNFGYPDMNPLPNNTIGSPLYVSYPMYKNIPKPNEYKAFFIIRDPRDMVVSWYFSTQYSHRPTRSVEHYRNDLEKLSLQEGLIYSIDILTTEGQFWAQKSWMQSEDDRRVKIFKYEDFANDNYTFMRKLFQYLEFNIPGHELDRLNEAHSFNKLTKGRHQGVEDKSSHYRKGKSGDWKTYFDSSVSNYFSQKTGDLLDVLNYSD